MDTITQSASATLCAHAGSEIITRQQLMLIEPPQATATHTPIAHYQLLDLLEGELWKHQIKIEDEQYSVMTQGMKLFGVMKLQGAYSGFANGTETQALQTYSMALGIRASNDKKFPVELIAGMNIFVCDNLAFNGDIIALRRRHTKLLDIRQELASGVQRALGGFQSLGAKVEGWKRQELSGDRAKALILEAGTGLSDRHTGETWNNGMGAKLGDPVMPLHLIPDVLREWLEPRHPEFEPRTAWSLHNSFTEAFKKLKPHVAMESARRLDGLMMSAMEKGN